MDKAKALGLFRLRMIGVLNDAFNQKVSYGMNIYIPGAAGEIEKIALQLLEDLEGGRGRCKRVR